MVDNISLYGFRPVRTVTGKNCVNVLEGRIATGYGAAPGGTDVGLHRGDPLARLSTGYLGLAAADTEIFGIAHGFKYWDGTKMVYNDHLPHEAGAYGTNLARQTKVLYTPVAGVIFEIDCDEAVTATTEAAYIALLGENADISINADATSGEARPLLDISDHKTATAQLRLLEISKTVHNRDFAGARVKMLVTVNESSFKFGNDPSADGV